jgi:ATP-dependent Clp protease ATP-binding subunit ClpC
MASSFFNTFFGDTGLRDFASVLNQAGQKLREALSLNRYFNEQTKQVVQDAAQLALERGRGQVDTEHILYALAANPSGQAILDRCKVDKDKLRTYIEQVYLSQPVGVAGKSASDLDVSPKVKSAMETAFDLSRELGHSYVGPEHVLFGLAKEPDGSAGEILRKVGVTPENAKEQVIEILGREVSQSRSNTPKLDRYSRDLTALARQGQLDPVIGRAVQIETTIEILARRKKNNPILIGEPGVGKTAIVEGLAQKIVDEEVPNILRNRRVIELNVTSLVAGSQYRGQFEERVNKILGEALKYKDEIILFIDEIHVLIGAGSGEGAMDAANIIKPALARGELNLIGATTLNEYQRHIEKDAAFERRFQPVFIPEPTVEETVAILNGLRDKFEAHHRVSITDEAIIAAAALSERFITNRFLPDKAIDLVDQAAARVKIATTYKNDGAESEQVRAEHIADTVARLTGVPVSDLSADEREKLLNLEERLHARVVGQDRAITAVSDAIRLSRSGMREHRRPIAALFFVGPSGTGKTELAKAVAETVFGSEDALIRIDLSEYSEKHSVARLVGAPPGYVGYDEGGQLTERVRRRPYSVLLLDEFDKAHADAQNLMLQMLDEGRLTDSRGRLVDFHNTFVIATANISMNNLDVDNVSDEWVASHLAARFAPELMNRFDDFIFFAPLTHEQICEVVLLQLDRVSRAAAQQGINLTFDNSLVEFIADVGYSKSSGARELRRRIRTHVEAAMAKAVLNKEINRGDSVVVSYDEQSKQVKFSTAATQ